MDFFALYLISSIISYFIFETKPLIFVCSECKTFSLRVFLDSETFHECLRVGPDFFSFFISEDRLNRKVLFLFYFSFFIFGPGKSSPHTGHSQKDLCIQDIIWYWSKLESHSWYMSIPGTCNQCDYGPI